MERKQESIEVQRYQRELEAERKARQASDARIAALERSETRARYERDLTELQTVQGLQFDLAEELEDCCPLDLAKPAMAQPVFDARKAKMLKRYQKAPVSAMLPPEGRETTTINPDGKTNGLTDEQFEAAVQYQRGNPGKGWVDCVRYAREGEKAK